MKKLCRVVPGSILLVIVAACPLFAQPTETTVEVSLADALGRLASPVDATGATASGLIVGTQLEVATAPLGSSSGGFTFVFDPASGLEARSAPTFGPAFGERALTLGAGKLSVGVNLLSRSYDKLGDFNLIDMELGSTTNSRPQESLTGRTSLVLSSQSLVVSGTMGVTDHLDVGIVVPFVKVKLDGVSSLVNGWTDAGGAGEVVNLVRAQGVASGVGDIALTAKYRFMRFGADDALPDPGGLAALVRARLNTGDAENLRGLGTSRVLGGLVFSSGVGRFRPHVNAGYEWWSDARIVQSFNETRRVRHQIEYTAGVEVEATPRATILLDVLGRHIRGGGNLSIRELQVGATGIQSIRFAVMEGGDVRKITLAPGFKANIRGSLLLTASALIPLDDNGLYDEFTPVVGLDWTF